MNGCGPLYTGEPRGWCLSQRAFLDIRPDYGGDGGDGGDPADPRPFDAGRALLEAVASNDVDAAAAALDRHARDWARTYCWGPLPLGADARPPPRVPRCVVDLVNNTRDADGYSPLILALDDPAEHGLVPMVRFLLDHGADLRTAPPRVRARIAREAQARRVTTSFHRTAAKPNVLLRCVFDAQIDNDDDDDDDDDHHHLHRQDQRLRET
jgi:hypothetical protein